MSRKLAIWMLALLAAGAGCKGLAFILPEPPRQTVRAEFDGLADQNIAVVIYADESVEFEYPGTKLQLTSLIASQLRTNVEGATVVDARRVLRYQLENSRWDEMDRAELGARFGADYVLFISLVNYSMREPGTVGIYRGRIDAEAIVYDCSRDERRGRVWDCTDLSVVYPSGGPTGQIARDDRRIRQETASLFADRLVKKFYKHKVPGGG